MKLMTVWRAYQIVVAELEYGWVAHGTTKAEQDNLYRKKLRFREYITERIKECDDLHDWAIQEIDNG